MSSNNVIAGSVGGIAEAANGAAAFPDLHHKMSKKIAQLTKVIYHLNTKNDDHDLELKNLADTYESEIEEVCVFFLSFFREIRLFNRKYFFVCVFFLLPLLTLSHPRTILLLQT